jgi:hypothetical protein
MERVKERIKQATTKYEKHYKNDVRNTDISDFVTPVISVDGPGVHSFYYK